MEVSISPKLMQELKTSYEDHQLDGKFIAVILAAMRHRDYVYLSAHQLGAKLIFIDSHFPEWTLPYVHDTLYCSDATQSSLVIPLMESYITTQNTLLASQGIDVTINPFKFDGVVSFDDYSVVSAAEIAEHFHLPGIPTHVVSSIKHKHVFRQETTKAGISVPQSCVLPTKEFLNGDFKEELLTNWKFPIVLKPIAGAGSHFVRKIVDYDELYRYLDQYQREASCTGEVSFWNVGPTPSCSPRTSDPELNTRNAISNITPDNHISAPFMIEELMVGPEVDIDLVVDRGVIKFLGIADNFPAQGPPGMFLESGGAQPSLLPQTQLDELVQMTKQLISHFGTDLHGVFHFEAMYLRNGHASPIELNLRLGGSEVLTFGIAVYGVNLGLQALKLACGINLEQLNTTPLRQCVSTNILAAESGYVRRVGFHDKNTVNNPHFMGGMHRCWINQPLKTPPLGYQYCGWMVVSGDNLEQAKKNMDFACDGFFCDIAPYLHDNPQGLIPGTTTHYLLGSERENWALICQEGIRIASYQLHPPCPKITTASVAQIDQTISQ